MCARLTYILGFTVQYARDALSCLHPNPFIFPSFSSPLIPIDNAFTDPRYLNTAVSLPDIYFHDIGTSSANVLS